MADADNDTDLLSDEEKAILSDPEYLTREDEPEDEGKAAAPEDRLIPLDQLDENGDPLPEPEDAEEGAKADPEPEKEEPAAAIEDDEIPDRSGIVDPRTKVEAWTEADAASLTKLDADKKALVEKWDEGELTSAEYSAEQEKLIAQQTALAIKKDRWDVAEKDWKATVEKIVAEDDIRWDNTVAKWMDAHPELIGASENALANFHKICQTVTGSPDLSDGLTFKQMLDLAFDTFKVRYPRTLVETKAEPAKKEAPKEHPADKARREAAAKPVPTLAHLPAAAVSDAGEGEFAALDALIEGPDPEAGEAALAAIEKRDPAAYARYMAL